MSITDNEEASGIRFCEGQDFTATEGGDSTMSVCLEFAGIIAPGETVSVDYLTTDVTAVAGSDYETTSGTITFTPDNQQQTFEIPIINNEVIEATETFEIVLTNVVSNIGAGIIDDLGSVVTGTILDDDAQQF